MDLCPTKQVLLGSGAGFLWSMSFPNIFWNEGNTPARLHSVVPFEANSSRRPQIRALEAAEHQSRRPVTGLMVTKERLQCPCQLSQKLWGYCRMPPMPICTGACPMIFPVKLVGCRPPFCVTEVLLSASRFSSEGYLRFVKDQDAGNFNFRMNLR